VYFDVFLNGQRLGAFGHRAAANLTISVSGSPEGSYVFAGAVCREGGQRYHHDWLQRDLGATDDVRIVSANPGPVVEPIKKFDMGRTKRKAWERNVCEFCQRNEAEVTRLIPVVAYRGGKRGDFVEIPVIGRTITS